MLYVPCDRALAPGTPTSRPEIEKTPPARSTVPVAEDRLGILLVFATRSSMHDLDVFLAIGPERPIIDGKVFLQLHALKKLLITSGCSPKMGRESVLVTGGGDDEIGVSTVPEMLMRSDTPLDFARGTEHAAANVTRFRKRAHPCVRVRAEWKLE